ncbi:MAG: aminoacyl-tRNA hydrolase [Candidatus Omnitrophota bacterium]
MKLIVGLGNPGIRYANTRHNIGFTVIKLLAVKYKIALKKERNISCLLGRAKLEDESVLLVLPLSYMNHSGECVLGLVRKYKIALEDILVVSDDLDLELGRIKIRPEGSSAGHKGLKSIIDFLKDDNFSRLRVGIGREAADKAKIPEYVLSRFSRRESRVVQKVIEKSVLCCLSWLEHGVAKAMNVYNCNAKPLVKG